MSLLASFSFSCDMCETDTGDSRPTPQEAREYAESGGWAIAVGFDRYDLCEDCKEFLGVHR